MFNTMNYSLCLMSELFSNLIVHYYDKSTKINKNLAMYGLISNFNEIIVCFLTILYNYMMLYYYNESFLGKINM